MQIAPVPLSKECVSDKSFSISLTVSLFAKNEQDPTLAKGGQEGFYDHRPHTYTTSNRNFEELFDKEALFVIASLIFSFFF